MPELEEVEGEISELLEPVGELIEIYRSLEALILANSPTRWMIALGIAIIFFLGTSIFQIVMRWRFGKHAAETETFVDDAIVIITKTTKGWVKLVVSIYLAAAILALPEGIYQFIGTVAGISFLIQLGIWGSALITAWSERYTQRNLKQDAGRVATAQLLSYIVRLLLYAIIVLLVLENLPGINITPLLASVGIGGIAIALAVQNILSDLFASLSIMLDKPFIPGEFIVVGDVSGTVERIGIKTTRLRSLSGEHLVFSNADLLNSRIQNFTRMTERRIVFSVGVVYETTPEQMRLIPMIIREAITAQEMARFDRSHFQRFDAFALTFETVYFVLSSEFMVYMDIQQAINLIILERFAAEGISFAYPTQIIYMGKDVVDSIQPG